MADGLIPRLPEESGAAPAVIERLRAAREEIDRTCRMTGAGYLLVMFVPSTDMVMRSFAGIDSVEEAKALANEVIILMARHGQNLIEKEKAQNATPPAEAPGPVTG
jgi:hypothetical protein